MNYKNGALMNVLTNLLVMSRIPILSSVYSCRPNKIFVLSYFFINTENDNPVQFLFQGAMVSVYYGYET